MIQKKTNMFRTIINILLLIFICFNLIVTGHYLRNYILIKDDTLMPPSDFVHQDNIYVYSDHFLVNLSGYNIIWSRFKDSGSMKPILHKGHNAVEIIPKSIGDIHLGDIISYMPTHEESEISYIHRVVEINYDQNGTYFIVQGDNNDIPDPERVRFKQIVGKVVAIIY